MAKKRKEKYEIRAAGGEVVGVVDHFLDVAQKCCDYLMEKERLKNNLTMKEMEKFFCGWTSEIVLEQENSYEQDTFTLGIKVYFAVDEDDKKYTFKDDVGDSFEVFIIFV